MSGPFIPVPNNNVYRLLNQDKVWVDGSGTLHYITQMSRGYRENVMFFLVRNARRYESKYRWGEMVLYTQAPDDVWRDLEREWDQRFKKPERWMRMTQIYHGLYRANFPHTYQVWLNAHPKEAKIRYDINPTVDIKSETETPTMWWCDFNQTVHYSRPYNCTPTRDHRNCHMVELVTVEKGEDTDYEFR